ncbi:hypothetical protein [Nocardioides koreensis]
MISLWIAVIGILGTLSASVATQWLQTRAADRRSLAEEHRRISDLRREALAEFADTLMSYRRAQLHNWHEARAQGVDADQTAVAAELRELRARAWSAMYRVQLLWREKAVVAGAAGLVDAVTKLKALEDKHALGKSADQVREDLSALMDRAREESLLGSVK